MKRKKPDRTWQEQISHSYRKEGDAELAPFVIAVSAHIRSRVPDLTDSDMERVALDVYMALCTASIAGSLSGWRRIPTARGRQLVLAAFLTNEMNSKSDITDGLIETMENTALMEGVRINRGAMPAAEQWQIEVLLEATALLQEAGAKSRPSPLWLP